VILPAKCVSSVSPRFHYRRLAFCFLPLAAILESPRGIPFYNIYGSTDNDFVNEQYRVKFDVYTQQNLTGGRPPSKLKFFFFYLFLFLFLLGLAQHICNSSYLVGRGGRITVQGQLRQICKKLLKN
jgi:hypothetical protein